MGRKLDALLGRKSKTYKLKTTLNLAVSRLSILKNQRHARFNIARSDVIQLLHLNHHQQAILRVEQVIKDQNLLDVYDMIHGYCHLIIQRINLFTEQANDCPGELKEAVLSILYAAPRCGEFPELQEIRAILTACFGKEFVNNAIESRRNSGVSQKMIEKLSPKQSSLECRMKMLKGIAEENGVVLQLEISSPEIKKEKLEEVAATVLPDKIEKVLSLSESMKRMKKYRDVADAAQDAFESAAYAAAAARAAVELSRSESFASDGPDSPKSEPKNVVNSESVKSKLNQMESEQRYSSSKYDSESEYEEIVEENTGERSKYNMKVEEFDDLYSDDYLDDENIVSFEKKMHFDGSNYKTEKEQTWLPSRNANFSSYKQFPLRHEANPKAGLGWLSVKDAGGARNRFGK